MTEPKRWTTTRVLRDAESDPFGLPQMTDVEVVAAADYDVVAGQRDEFARDASRALLRLSEVRGQRDKLAEALRRAVSDSPHHPQPEEKR